MSAMVLELATINNLLTFRGLQPVRLGVQLALGPNISQSHMNTYLALIFELSTHQLHGGPHAPVDFLLCHNHTGQAT